MAARTSGDIAEAVKLLRQGRLVAFPTETVYGLGADATSSVAVGRIFAAKERPATNPLIVHVADEAIARRYAADWPVHASRLAAAFWPGPLTIVVPKTDKIVPEVTAGRQTVGLRVPRHPLALELLAMFDGGVAAPSANPSGRVSPTTAEHVRDQLGDRVDMILDGGACEVGIESTVLDLSGRTPVILRPGGVSRSEIEELIGPVAVAKGSVAKGQAAPGPGMHAAHYRPIAPLYLFTAGEADRIAQWRLENPKRTIAILHLNGFDAGTLAHLAGDWAVEMPLEPGEYAHRLYAFLHEADRRGVHNIWVQTPPDTTPWFAIHDRLQRAVAAPLA